ARRQELIEAAQQQQNLAEFILTKVDKDIYHPAMILPPEQPLNEVTQTLKSNGIDSALVRLNDDDMRLLDDPHQLPYGIITRTNMLHAVMLDGHPLDTPVGT
ncbi:cyclic nucleotide-binding protein, partial [Vibrio xuii]